MTSEHVGDLVSEGIDLAIRFGQPRLSTLVSRKLIEAPILTLASPRYLERYGKPKHPSDLARHRCLQFLDPYTGRPFDWEFIRGKETIEVPTSGPLTFTDPKSMLEECVAGTGIAQVIGWGVKELLASGALIDLFPALARRALPAVRLPSITQASAGQSPGFYGFLRRDSRQADLDRRHLLFSNSSLAELAHGIFNRGPIDVVQLVLSRK